MTHYDWWKTHDGNPHEAEAPARVWQGGTFTHYVELPDCFTKDLEVTFEIANYGESEDEQPNVDIKSATINGWSVPLNALAVDTRLRDTIIAVIQSDSDEYLTVPDPY